ncbi:MAG: MerR family transcriptional regulator, partial [Deltaproteobacteria bacterium]|nr:MerR family transcriptional regulator [Deltaproteobacteria bacterium]
IGTVSTLTDLDPHTIRAWERRYEAIKPARTETGRRRYDDRTVERLQLLKALVDCSEAIGTIAHLADDELRARLEKLADLEGQRTRSSSVAETHLGKRSLALLAPSLSAQLRANAVALADLELVLSEHDEKEFIEAARRQICDVVVVELDALETTAPLGFVRSCQSLPGSPLVVVLYHFAQRSSLARLAQAGAKLVQSPVRLEQLRRTILDRLMIEQVRERRGRPASTTGSPGASAVAARASENSREAPVRRFDDEQLARLFEISAGIACECPNHLASLVSALAAFEAYSAACESRDEADAALHRHLAQGTGEARARLETLLFELCEHEGIRV